MPSASHCVIDTHPNAIDIGNWLKGGLTSTAINKKLRAMSPDPEAFKPFPPSTLSIHRTVCLGMAKMQPGRPPVGTRVKLSDLVTPGETDEQIIRETKTLSLALFRHRLKTDPSNVSMKDLTPVLTSILRLEGKGSKRDPLDDAMENAIGSADEDEEQAASPSSE